MLNPPPVEKPLDSKEQLALVTDFRISNAELVAMLLEREQEFVRMEQVVVFDQPLPSLNAAASLRTQRPAVVAMPSYVAATAD